MSKRVAKKLAFYDSFDFDFSFEKNQLNDFSNLKIEEQDNLIHNLLVFLKNLISSKNIQFNTFSIAVSWPNLSQESIDNLKKSIQYRLIEEFKANFQKSIDFANPDASFLINFDKKAVFLSLKPVFVYGKYCKYSRDLAQTEHFCRFCKGRGCDKCALSGLTTQNSVEQILAKFFIKQFDAKNMLFHGAGREDVDVLMLGKGRPFVVELIQPLKRNLEINNLIDLNKLRDSNLINLENEINFSSSSLISINSLRYSTKEELIKVKNNPHDKIYQVTVALINQNDEFDIKQISLILDLNLNRKEKIIQRTPVRVEKRRADLNREKEITFLSYQFISNKEFKLNLRTSHGTYVKEFISGDEERTTPSLSMILLKPCFCKQLDVIEICEE
ncbi:MAG: tRNA pseudouridine(54/55) synthase Pus10 [Candidatus ainarchaeum sp.]|nr:tRNA pseudouridine(54/55) synthase Pus10 [Candidatus ainarchaeum sp.]